MSVIPLTLTISLCLVFTFVVFFWREHSRQRFRSAESDALLPLADEMPRLARRDETPAKEVAPAADQHDAACPCQRGERPPCPGCLTREA
jgi:hypothetical protein